MNVICFLPNGFFLEKSIEKKGINSRAAIRRDMK